MAFLANSWIVVTDDGEFPTCFLPPEVATAPEERESYMDIQPIERGGVRGRFWMTKSQFDALPANIKSGQSGTGFKLKMTGMGYDRADLSAGIKGITLETAQATTFANVFTIIKAAISRASISGEPIYEVLFCGFRYQNFWAANAGPVTETPTRYTPGENILSKDKRSFIFNLASSASVQTEWDDCAISAGFNFDTTQLLGGIPVNPPYNFYFTYYGLAENLRRLTSPYSIQTVQDPYSRTEYYKYLDYTDTSETTALSALGAKCSYEGSGIDQDINPISTKIIPSTISIVFYKAPFISGNTSGPTSQAPIYTTTYVYNNPVSTGATISDLVVCGDRFDCPSPNYTQDLQDVADERAAAFWRRVNIPYNTWVFVGGYDFIPGATIRRVKVTMDVSGWYTTVWQHGLADSPREAWEGNFTLLGTKKPFGLINRPVGSIMPFVCYRDDGTIDVLNDSTDCFFPVFVKRVGGGAGSYSTPSTCNFTYDVRDWHGAVLATGVQPTKSRIENVEYIGPSTLVYTIGVGYFDTSTVTGTAFKLYEVGGEYPKTNFLTLGGTDVRGVIGLA